ncbi:ATP-dependent DNA helicase [Enhygromyxa salina]|uniref:ATP-dependent DNA helicase n=1 Tax=Enhygromyxa salina TaxID=215803 RepID=A0A0C2D4T8_9BACT|nr:ATP-binding protein [Enhygromyxa salina]KIG16695.1 ATP-dependent DNA helicase [Enhygromyxa salina]
MRSAEEIVRLAADLESFEVERKASVKAVKKEIEEAICAYSNDLPGAGGGVILVGVTDRTGKPTGLPITDELLLSLTNIRSDGNILPFPLMTVYKAVLDGKAIAVVEVEASPNPPVELRGRVCVRVGPRKGTATRDEVRILTERRRGWDGPFDQRAIPGSTLRDLDLDLFRQEYLPSAVDPEVLSENGRSVPEQLAALHLASPDGVPNVAGMLVLGHEPTTFVPGAYIQFLRVDGAELTDPIIDRKDDTLVGPLPVVLRRIDEITNAHIRVSTSLAGTVETRRPDYPIAAMQQLLRNAVMHRNYETSNAPVVWYWFTDRIEIHNPGGLFGRATEASFGSPGGNDYRNPTIAAALHHLGFVQRFGMGIALARKACRDNDNPAPEFIFGPSSFGVIVRRRT